MTGLSRRGFVGLRFRVKQGDECRNGVVGGGIWATDWVEVQVDGRCEKRGGKWRVIEKIVGRAPDFFIFLFFYFYNKSGSYSRKGGECN